MRGVVVKGKRLGSRLGFPTANIVLEPGQTPPLLNGVYLGRVSIDGRDYYAIINQGLHPTFPEGPRTIEAHIFDYDGDAYSKPIELDYIQFMRGEEKFSSPEALVDRISSDVAQAKRLVAQMREQPGGKCIKNH
ncbi:MAG: riboflavin kinase [Clostridia bacterium]|nr:riboflavin kinase [Clostridia bacterium]